MNLSLLSYLYPKTAFLLTILCFCSISLIADNNTSTIDNNAQEEHCGADLLHQYKLNIDPTYENKVKVLESKMYERMQKEQAGLVEKSNNVITIPVVVHVVHRSNQDEGENEYLTLEDVQEKIDQVNDAYSHASDAVFPGHPFDGTDIGIRFELADIDPDGNPTDGVTWHSSNSLTDDYFSGYEVGDVMGAYHWDPYSYANVYVVHNIDGPGSTYYLGYATFAGSHGDNDDGLVLRYDVSAGVWAHEFGHYFNLYHTYNGYSSNCPSNYDCLSQGDRVCDTAPHRKYSVSDCDHFSNDCSNDDDDDADYNPYRSESLGGLGDGYDPVYNYMSKGCRESFTEGQRSRMRYTAQYFRESLMEAAEEVIINNNSQAPDVVLGEINAAEGLICSDEFQPTITINNDGNITIEEVDIEVLLDDDLVYETSWEGSLDPNETTSIVLPNIEVDDIGEHELQINLTNPNGTDDAWTVNNSASVSFAYLIPEPLELGASCDYQIFSNEEVITSGVASPGCDNFQGNDLWFEVIVPESGSFIARGSEIDFSNAGMALYTGECGNLTLIECDEDSGSGQMPRIDAEDLEPGSSVYLRFWERSNNSFGDFRICVYDPNMEPLADAGIGAVSVGGNAQSSSGIASGDYDIEISLQNFGATTLENLEIEWFVDDEQQESYFYEDGVAGDGEVEITLGNYEFEEARPYNILVRTTNPNGNDDANTDNDELEINVNILAKADLTILLEGGYNVETGLMKTNLHENELLPLEQPYHNAPWDYNGNEEMDDYDDFPDNVVDWILVEVRTGSPNLTGEPGTSVLEAQAALLLDDGSIVDHQTFSSLVFESVEQDQEFYFVIRHRNHLDILSGEAIAGNGLITFDFTEDEDRALGLEQLVEVEDGKFAMIAGDYVPDAIIQLTDQDRWLQNTAILYIYSVADGSLDGIIQNTDNDLWIKNRAKLGILEVQY